MGKIYYVMGKSSSGKDTVYKKLLERHPGFRTIVPYTTRPIREGERDGVEYFFVDDERLREMQEAEQVIEVRSYNTRCGIWTYFTADDGQIDLKTHDYLVIGTLVSYRALREYFGAEKLLPVYIEVEDGQAAAQGPVLPAEAKCTVEGNRIRCSYDSETLSSAQVIRTVMEQYRVLDVKVKEADIDDVVEEIYRKG